MCLFYYTESYTGSVFNIVKMLLYKKHFDGKFLAKNFNILIITLI